LFYAEKSESALGYHVSHTIDNYLIDQRGVLQARFKHTDRAALMAAGVKRLWR
jgi:cytochrome oxidase Cu insertion factor (SCO1/SenC/PrrC family)